MGKLEELRKRLSQKLFRMAVSKNKVEYTRENFDMIFPDNKIMSPIGEIKLGEHQFEKLKGGREHLLGAMSQVLSEPIIIIDEDNNGKKAKLFTKSFNDDPKKIKSVTSVIVAIDNKKIAISTHPSRINNVLNRIKKSADLIYEKPDSGIMATAGTDPYCPNLAKNGDTQSNSVGTGGNPSYANVAANPTQPSELLSNNNIPQNTENVKQKNE